MNSEHIDFIIKDLHRRGIILEDFEDEVIDHVCSAVAEKMSQGQKFKDAYDEVIQSFGNTSGLHKTQEQVIRSNHKSMLKSYFIIALRNHLKQRFYTVINVGGLAVGVAACLVISLFLIKELSYDRHLPNSDRIYRIQSEIKFGPNHFKLASTSGGVAPAMAKDYSDVEAWVRLDKRGPQFVTSAGRSEAFKESGVYWADSTFFKVFSIRVLEGNPDNALTELNSVAISKSIAEKYFHGKSALGGTLSFRGGQPDLKITAVYEDLPVNTHFHPQMLVSMAGNKGSTSESLVGGGDFITYFLLREGTDPVSLESKFVSFVDKYVAPQIGAVVGGDFTIETFRESGQIWDYTLMPVTDIHLRSDRVGEMEANGSITYVMLLSSIGLLILGIACVNFINLSTARSSTRAKEVGVRKVMGSMHSHLIRQFLIESTVLTVAAFTLSVFFAWLFMPYFNELALQDLSVPFGSPLFYVILLGAALLIGIVAGLYPSFFLSAFKPVKVLTGNVTLGGRSGFVRSSLVVFQFMISIFLIIGTIVIQRQLTYIQGKNLGFEKDQVLVIRDAYQLQSHLREFKDEILTSSFVNSATISGFLPVSDSWRGRDTFSKEGGSQNLDEMVSLLIFEVDADYIKTLGMKVVEGREFNSLQTSDSTGVLINEAAVRALGYGKETLGKKLTQIVGNNPDGTPNPNDTKTWTVIGVVQDFHFESMKDAIAPLAFFLRPSTGSIALRFEALHTSDVIDLAEKTWKKMAPGTEFVYSFLDDDFERMYTTERRLGKIFATFSGLAILIACLGLFGLTAFTAEQRSKEIGIRKVLGASVPNIVMLLSKEFGVLVMIAYVLAAPAAWYSTNWWLEGYTYKTEIGVFVYLLAGIAAFGVAWLTMSYQSIKAAIANPVKSLRSE
ncbi:MAG TPA: ABC transporter permease [Cyclobacteriaceae bacterium]|nr:ABC transporter permease [Cyclobacteriaceae bacterium]